MTPEMEQRRKAFAYSWNDMRRFALVAAFFAAHVGIIVGYALAKIFG